MNSGKPDALNPPFFSIGVTAYRRPHYLKECLATILDQEWKNFEVLIGNDDPAQALNLEDLGIRDPRFFLFNRQKNLGEMANMNDLLARARGRYFTWIADDDLYDRRFFSTLYPVIEKENQPGCLFTDYQTGAQFVPVESSMETEVYSGRDFLKKFLRRELLVLGGSGVWRRDYLQEEGGIQQLGVGFSPGSDVLLAASAGKLPKIFYVRAPLIFFRTHRESASFSSVDLNAYYTAHKDFCSKIEGILHFPSLEPDFQKNYFQVLNHWCLQHFYSVLGRNRSIELSALLKYLAFIFQASQSLGSARVKVLFLAVWDLRLILRARLAKIYHRVRRIERYS